MNGAELPGAVEAGGGGPRKSLASGGLRVLPSPCLRALHDGGLRVVASVRHTGDGDGLGRLMLPDIHLKPI